MARIITLFSMNLTCLAVDLRLCCSTPDKSDLLSLNDNVIVKIEERATPG